MNIHVFELCSSQANAFYSVNNQAHFRKPLQREKQVDSQVFTLNLLSTRQCTLHHACGIFIMEFRITNIKKHNKWSPRGQKSTNPRNHLFSNVIMDLMVFQLWKLKERAETIQKYKIDFHSFHFSGDKRTELHDPGSGLLYSRQTQECLEAQTRVKVVMSFWAALSVKSHTRKYSANVIS